MANVRNPKFFIVDDDAHCRMRFHRHLVNLGYNNNILFDNGVDCLARLDMNPDVVFLDYDMKRDPPDDETLLAHIIGPSGKLRAPVIRRGSTLLIGFAEDEFAKVLGAK